MARPVLQAKKIVTFAGKTGTTTIDLTSGWTIGAGGANYTPVEGDFVLVTYASGSSGDMAIGVTTAGYAEIAELFEDDSFDTNLSVSWKIMGASPDSSVIVSSPGDTLSAGGVIIEIRSGVDPDTPLDVAAVTDAGANIGRPDPPAITPVTTDAVVIACGASSIGSGANAFTSGDLDNFLSDTQTDTRSVMIGSGSFDWVSGAVDPAQWGGGRPDTSCSWAAVTLALRPAADSGLRNGTSTGSIAFTGSASATHPVQGTASGTIAFTGTSAGTVKVQGSAPGSIAFTGSASGTVANPAIHGGASGSLSFAGSAAGTLKVAGTATSTFALTGAAAASVKVTAAASGSIGLTGSSAGTVRIAGAISGTVPLSGAAQCTIADEGASAGDLSLSGSATGKIALSGGVSGLLGLTGDASAVIGNAPDIGVTAGTLGLAGSAQGAVRVAGQAAGSLDFAGAAGAKVTITGIAAGSLGLSGTAFGTIAVAGGDIGALDLTGAATGAVSITGAANDNFELSGSATGLAGVKLPVPPERTSLVTRAGRTGTINWPDRTGQVSRADRTVAIAHGSRVGRVTRAGRT